MPIAQVVALDKLEQLKAMEITATEYLSNVTGESAFKTLAVAQDAVGSLAEIANTPFIGDRVLSPQFIDVDLYECLYTLAWRFGWILASINMPLLGVGLSATNPRRASNWNLLFALLAFVVYFNLVNLSVTWVGNGKLDLSAALLKVHGTAFVVALALLWWRDQGNRLRLLSRRSAAA